VRERKSAFDRKSTFVFDFFCVRWELKRNMVVTVIYTVEDLKGRERCFAWNEKMKIGGEGKGLFGSFGF
jgi:hypothetical protein